MQRTNSFSGGTNGATITTGNSGGSSGDAFNTVNGSPTYSSSNATGLRAPMASSFGTGTSARWTGLSLAARDIYIRTYVYFTGTVSAPDYFIWVEDATPTVLIAVTIDTSRHLSISNTLTPADFATGTVALSLNQWVRVEAKISIGTTTGNGSCELRLFNNADSGTASEITTASSINLGTVLPDRMGIAYAANQTVQHDDIGVSDAGFLGPVAGSLPRPALINQQAVVRSAFY